MPSIETASAIVNVSSICNASQRVRWIAFGAEDFSADMGISRTVDSDEAEGPYGEPGLFYARSAVTVAERAGRVLVLDTPLVKFRDSDGLRVDCSLARRLGYTGKMAIHSAQIDVIEAAFRLIAAEVEHARRVLEASDTAERDGRGSLSLDGEMVDAPVVARARNILWDVGLEL